MKSLTEKFKVSIAEDMKASFSSTDIYHLGIHGSIPFENDAEPPTPTNDVHSSHYEMFDDLVFGKRIDASNVELMINNIPWESGTVYAKYDDKDADLSSKSFYVMSSEGGNLTVFKCLDNNGDSPSTAQPLSSQTNPADELYITSDGYQWKYMFTITNADQTLFGTPSYMPVTPNANVVANAVSGAIDTIVIEEGGENYNSYASCQIKEAAVAGNNMLFALESDKFTDYFLTFADITGYVEEKVTSTTAAGRPSSGVVVGIFAANNTIRVTNVVRGFSAGKTVTGQSSATAKTIVSRERITSTLSANTDFYKNGSMYVSSGTGAGQLRTITEYIVTGEERRVLINTEFDVIPDQTSEIELLPRVVINGDGRSANAVVTVDPTTNTIFDIEVIDRGEGYTYADIVIAGNTGFLDTNEQSITTTQATARAIISPPEGHGANSAVELHANKLCVGMIVANTEANTVPTANDFRTVSIMKNMRFANLEFTLVESATDFTAGEVVNQPDTGAFGTIINREDNTMRITDIHGVFETGNSSVNLLVGNTSAVTSEVTAIDRSQNTFDARQIFQAEVLNLGPQGSGLLLDELVVQSGIDEIATDLINLTLDGSALLYADGEVITQDVSGATGTVTNRATNSLTLNNLTGTFTLDDIVGSAANVTSGVINKDNSISANGLGYVHELDANGAVVSLVGVRGTIMSSDDVAGEVNTIVGQKSGAESKITGRDYSNYYPISDIGDVLYIENMVPIERDDAQSERIKIIVEF